MQGRHQGETHSGGMGEHACPLHMDDHRWNSPGNNASEFDHLSILKPSTHRGGFQMERPMRGNSTLSDLMPQDPSAWSNRWHELHLGKVATKEINIERCFWESRHMLAFENLLTWQAPHKGSQWNLSSPSSETLWSLSPAMKMISSLTTGEKAITCLPWLHHQITQGENGIDHSLGLHKDSPKQWRQPLAAIEIKMLSVGERPFKQFDGGVPSSNPMMHHPALFARDGEGLAKKKLSRRARCFAKQVWH